MLGIDMGVTKARWGETLEAGPGSTGNPAALSRNCRTVCLRRIFFSLSGRQGMPANPSQYEQ